MRFILLGAGVFAASLFVMSGQAGVPSGLPFAVQIAIAVAAGTAAWHAKRSWLPLAAVGAVTYAWLVVWPPLLVASYFAGRTLDRTRGIAAYLAACLVVCGISALVGEARDGLQEVLTASLGNALFMALGMIGLPLAVGLWTRARSEVLEAAKERAQRLEREQVMRAEQARAQERARIAREMHDIVAHRVSLMVLHAGALEVRTSDEETARTAAMIGGIGREALANLRDVLGVLRAPRPEPPDTDHRLLGPDAPHQPAAAHADRRPGAPDASHRHDATDADRLTLDLDASDQPAADADRQPGDPDARHQRIDANADHRPGVLGTDHGVGDRPAGHRSKGLRTGHRPGTLSMRYRSGDLGTGHRPGEHGAGYRPRPGELGTGHRPADFDADYRPQPTLGDLDRLLDQSRALGIAVTRHDVGEPRPVEETVERTAYRVIQEALTNVHKHAGDARTDVLLRFGDGELQVEVRNQAPHAPREELPGAGWGLVGLRERVELLGGTLRTTAEESGGFLVSARIPA
ncbi:sensor histidine kinase [Nonomuraea gerenzanensis]|nr:sensor histidine kinase [Nonomuraea gerenzanensis]UBU14069.1 histidine kinase [Nonomuraea gerenzanensis]